jgi:hypothetical protein
VTEVSDASINATSLHEAGKVSVGNTGGSTLHIWLGYLKENAIPASGTISFNYANAETASQTPVYAYKIFTGVDQGTADNTMAGTFRDVVTGATNSSSAVPFSGLQTNIDDLSIFVAESPNGSSNYTVNNSFVESNDTAAFAANTIGIGSKLRTGSDTTNENATVSFAAGARSAVFAASLIPVPPNTSPTIAINEPDGISDTATVGNSYNINYDLADSEDTVTAAFYYDINNSGLDGSAIGNCSAALAGTGSTCSWDTSGMTPGTYYVYAVTDDGTNPQVSAYSSGQITINAAPVINTTTAGTAQALRGNTVIDVTAPYSDDDNGDNTMLIEWGLNGLNFSLGSESLAHTDTPYTYQITGLTNGNNYQVRVTYQDSDGVTGSDVQVFTDIIPVNFNPLIHSALSTGSSRWGGNWGLPGGQYGEFTCMTCHTKGASNIKRIRSSILNNTVVFNKTSGAGDSFGDDSDGRGSTDSSRVCEVCHTQTKHHRRTADATPDLTHNNQADCIQCHPHNQGFKPQGDCALCHAFGTSSSAPKVFDASGNNYKGTSGNDRYGSHLVVNTAQLLSGSTDWEAQCKMCHPMHSIADANTQVEIPLPPTNWNNNNGGSNMDMQTQLGIDYTTNGGIHLGGTATLAGNQFAVTNTPTEAEICWGCHGTNSDNNEWGYNTDTNGSFPTNSIQDIDAVTSPSHNYGWVYDSYNRGTNNFTGLTSAWVDASGNGKYFKFAYQQDSSNSYAMNERITSVHSVSFTAGRSSVADNVTSGIVDRSDGQTLEGLDDIRCSYCHDVHGLDKAVADTNTGKPYLRGSWMGNPYSPDMPPVGTSGYSTSGGPTGRGNRHYTSSGGGRTFPDAVPRLFTSSTHEKGGYFIDQNSGWPTKDPNYDTLAETAGICTSCHGTNVDTMDYYTGTSLWQGTNGVNNGHSNSALGGTSDTGKRNNLFDARRGSNYMAAQRGVNFEDYGKDYSGQPFRSYFSSAEPGKSNASNAPPRNTGWYGGTAGSATRGGQYGTWYGTGIGNDGSSGAVRAHSFSCSKCHTPHASHLPALLITNCLDQTLSTWTDSTGTVGVAGSHANADDMRNNCHRNEGTTTGWNNLDVGQ